MVADILAEVLLEVYLELMLLIVPEKNVTRKQRIVAKLAAVAVLVGLFALALWGIWLLADHANPWGVVPIAVAAVLSLAQILAGILLYKRNHN